MSAIRDPYQPVHTFTRTIQVQQIISYLVVTSLLIVFLAAVQGNYQDQNTRIVIMVFFLVTFCIVATAGLVASIIDPADPIMLIYRNGDRREILQYIDNCLYCDTCRSYVKSTSRHCKICNRCVNQFDHHCSWINNCIGQQNYTAFIIMIISVFFYLLIFCIAVGLLWKEKAWQLYQSAIIADWVFFAIALFVSIPLLILVILHFYLIAKGLTTFQFIMSRRQQQAHRPLEQDTKVYNKTLEELPVNNSRFHTQENIIFERTNTDDSHPQGQKTGIVQMTGIPEREKTKAHSPVKMNQSGIETHDNSAELQKIFQRNRSLKYLIGNNVLIKPNHNPDSYNRQYQTIRSTIKRDAENGQNIYVGNKNVRYSSQMSKRFEQRKQL